MPATLTYPGVYIEEIPSGVRTITGVATSITAFAGRAPRGPIDKPTHIFSFADYERTYGGLDAESTMSYAVRHFFDNGGSEAYIVRLFHPLAEADNRTAKADINGGVTVEAAGPGLWGNNLSVDVFFDGITSQTAEVFGLTVDQLFHLRVKEKVRGQIKPVVRETLLNLTTVENSPRRVDRVLERGSQLLNAKVAAFGGTPTAAADQSLQGGQESDLLTGLDDYFPEINLDVAPLAGVYLLQRVDLFNLLCLSPDRRDADLPPEIHAKATKYCSDRRAIYLIDSPLDWGQNPNGLLGNPRSKLSTDIPGLSGPEARNAAIYYPRVKMADPLRPGQLDTFPPCGAIAGRIAQTDASRGVWKAPAGIDAGLLGVQDFQVNLTDAQNGALNPVAINCLRSFPAAGRVIWGARTLRGDDQLADEYKYLPVRRVALFIEESLYRGTQFAVFEPNDEPLWGQLRLAIGAFMQNLFRQGAFQGTSPRDAYFVKCDKETTTQNDINLGIVNVVVGFAPLKPAEFVVIKIQQIAGQVQV